MTREDFIAGKPFTALNTEGEFVFVPTLRRRLRIGLIKNTNQKESGDMFCKVHFASDHDGQVYCERFMLGTQVLFQVPLSNFTVIESKKVKEVPNG